MVLSSFALVWSEMNDPGDDGFDDDEVKLDMVEGDVEPFEFEEQLDETDLGECLAVYFVPSFGSSCLWLFIDGFFLLSKYFSSYKRIFKIL